MMKPGAYIVNFRHLPMEPFGLYCYGSQRPIGVLLNPEATQVLLAEFKRLEEMVDRSKLIGYKGILGSERLGDIEVLGVVDFYE